MFALIAVQAFFGDSLLVEYGDPATPRYVLIDGGPAHDYDQHLSVVLRRVKARRSELDLMVLSHVDTDHVTGLLDYVAELRSGGAAAVPDVQVLWHNSFAKTIDVAGMLTPRLRTLLAAASNAMLTSAIAINGIDEGNQLRTQALARQMTLNPGFAHDVITVGSAAAPWHSANLELSVVGPTLDNLEALRTEWLEWLDKHEAAVSSGDPYVMANSDRSVPNLSSIQLLAKADGRTMLLTGDGRSDHLLDGLGATGLLDAAGRLHVDLLKLPHHGSDRNVNKSFFKKITADTYVASADGTYGNPDLATLIWIVEAAQEAGRKIRLVFTNETDSTKKLTQDYAPAEFGYELVFRDDGAHDIRIPLAE